MDPWMEIEIEIDGTNQLGRYDWRCARAVQEKFGGEAQIYLNSGTSVYSLSQFADIAVELIASGNPEAGITAKECFDAFGRMGLFKVQKMFTAFFEGICMAKPREIPDPEEGDEGSEPEAGVTEEGKAEAGTDSPSTSSTG